MINCLLKRNISHSVISLVKNTKSDCVKGFEKVNMPVKTLSSKGYFSFKTSVKNFQRIKIFCKRLAKFRLSYNFVPD